MTECYLFVTINLPFMKNLLVIEDEPAYMRLLTDKLSSEGYKVINAYDGKSGLKLALQEKPNLILLDIRLPIIDGLTMLKILRADAWGRDANVIILTNLDDSKTISTAMHEIISRYIVKSDTTLQSIINDIKILLKE